MPRDRSRQGAILAAVTVALYLPLQPALAWMLGAAALGGTGIDGVVRWTSAAVVLLLGGGLAAVLTADWRRRAGAGPMQRWATGTVSGLAVLVFLSALLTLTQAFLTWGGSHAEAFALMLDAAVLAWLGSIALVAVEPAGTSAATPAKGLRSE